MSDDLEGFDPHDDGESLPDDEAGRNAIAHLREQGELWPDLAFGPVSGQPGDDIHFAISRQTLKAATDATNLTLRAGREDVKLTVDVLSAGALRLTTSKRSITCRVVVRLEPNPKGIPEGGVRFSILRWSVAVLQCCSVAVLQCCSVARLIAPKDP